MFDLFINIMILTYYDDGDYLLAGGSICKYFVLKPCEISSCTGSKKTIKYVLSLLDRFFRAEDGRAVHLSDSVSHKHSVPLEARGSSGAPPLRVREDGHGVPGLHV